MTSARDTLLSCALKKVRVKLPEFGLDLYVREMDAGQREEYYSIIAGAIANKKPVSDVAARILLPSLYDLAGSRMLVIDDLDKLGALSPQVITKLTNSLLEVSGLLPAFYEAEKKRLKRQRGISFFSSWRRGWENLSRKFSRSPRAK